MERVIRGGVGWMWDPVVGVGWGCAYRTVVEEEGVVRVMDGPVQVGIPADDEGGLAAELQRHLT
jgi:hypothetical protein